MTLRNALYSALMIAIWSFMVLSEDWAQWKLDLTAIYYAARSWAEGMPDLFYTEGPLTIYIHPPQQWVDWAVSEGWDDPQFTPYIYPPIWAILLSWFTPFLSAGAFFNIVLLLNMAACVWMTWLVWSLVQPKSIIFPLWLALGLFIVVMTAPGYMALLFGQPQVIVSALCLASIVALNKGRDAQAGAWLALAAAAKLSPAFLIVIFVMERRWKALVSFALIGGALGLASIALGGWPLHQQFMDKLSAIEEVILLSPLLVSLEQLFYQIAVLIDGGGLIDLTAADKTLLMVHDIWWINALVMLFLILGTVLTWWLTRGVAQGMRLWSRLMVLSLVSTLASPLGWVHYLILPLVMLPGVLARGKSRRDMIWIAVFVLPFLVPLFTALTANALTYTIKSLLYIVASLAMIVLSITTARGSEKSAS